MTGRIPPYKSSTTSFIGATVILLAFLLCSLPGFAGNGIGNGSHGGGGGGKSGGSGGPGNGGKEDPAPFYDETSIAMMVQGVGVVQIPAAIRNNIAYLSVTDVFDYLKIRNIPSSGLDSVSGFFISQDATFLIDRAKHRILYHGKVFELKPNDMIHAETSLYLRADYFGQVFGLDCKFNFRSLSVTLTTSLELPVIREMRQELMRKNIRSLRGEVTVDSTLPGAYHIFRMGMADWQVITTENQQGPDDTRLNLALGAVIAGGETDLSVNYDNNIPFREREQYYQWHYVNNDHDALRQVTAGKFFIPTISSIYSPIVGVQFTNAPTIFRRSFGTYPLTGFTGPEWIVELYVNNELVNYVKADAAGFFAMDVPLVYGSSEVKLRYYGPWGEERSSQQLIQIPYNFLPFRQLEYAVSAGVEEDTLHSRFTRGALNYGLSTSLTVGGGVEYLSSITSGKSIPFVNASFREGYNLLVSGEYAYGVRIKIIANYHFPSQLQFEADYTRYKKGQTAINNLYLEERKAIVSYPFLTRKLSAYTRLTFYEIVLPSSTYTTVEHLLSGVIHGVNTNITTYALYANPAPPFIYSNFSLAFRLPWKLIFNPSAQYEYDDHKVMEMRGEVGKYVGKGGYFNTYYENNFKSGFQSVGIGFRYTFSFAQAGMSVIHANHASSSTVQSASGSLMYDPATHYLGASNHSSVGRGGIIVLPFLDLNGNGRRDKGEPKVTGVKIQINSGRTVYNEADTLIRVSELEPYTSYIVRLNPDLDHVAWKIKNMTLSVAVDPNQFKLVEIPVSIMGEVAGTVYLKEKDTTVVQGRVTVDFYQGDSTLAGQVVTEADGTFDFTGLPVGNYTARISPEQLEKLHMTSLPLALPFTILPKKEGDVVEGLQFTLQRLPKKKPEPLPL